MHVAEQTQADIMQGQYLGRHFFAEGLNSFNRVVSEGIFSALKQAKRVAWHIDVGGGALLIRYYALNGNYHRESHFVQARSLATHTAKAMFDGFMRALTQPSRVLVDSDVLTEREVCEKTFVFCV